jgi:23S rRNA (pseudouridine1915-N3)-methyltransferase
MKLRLLWVGKTQEEWLKCGIEEYRRRIGRYFPLEISEVRDEKGAEAEIMRHKECERLEKALAKGARLILLDERGEELTSPQFADVIGRYRDSGTQELAFAIGGPYGFSESFRSRAHRTIALSRMTFTHQMVRLFLVEQIYRGCTILNNEQYHH